MAESGSDGALAGLSILVLRPARQGAALAEQFRDVGARAQVLSLTRIERVELEDAAGANQLLQGANRTVIFTSPNAVEHAFGQGLQISAHTVVAIGPGTARMLQDHGCHASLPVESFNSEGVLAMPEFSVDALERNDFTIVTGAKGRGLLQNALRTSGTRVNELIVYRRVTRQPDEAELAQTLQSAPDLMVVSSAEVVRDLAKLNIDELLTLPMVVPSDRVAEAARAHGFSGKRLLAKSASQDDILSTVLEWAKKRGG